MSILLSNFMELSLWVHQLKSHLLTSNLFHLSQNQLEVTSVSNAILLAYLFTLVRRYTASKAFAALAVFTCIIVSYSPLYNMLDNIEYYSSFALIYALTTLRIFKIHAKALSNGNVNSVAIKIAVGCCIMATFNLIMAGDRYLNDGIQTWTYRNYELITCLIHGLILSSGVRWQNIRWRKHLEGFASSMRSWLHLASNFRGL